jgi:hypothetical protein
MTEPRTPGPGVWITQIVIGALLLGLGGIGVGLGSLAASIESPTLATLVSTWLLAGAGLLCGAGLIVVGVVGLLRHRRARNPGARTGAA